MKQFYKITFTITCCLLIVFTRGQLVITGTVYDSTRTIPVKGVSIKSTGGALAVTDTNGRYSIVVALTDSLFFMYQNKPTLKFAVREFPGTGVFDIALHVRVDEKYKRLKEVKIYTKSYRQDSLENRDQYAKIFNYQKPGISLTTNNYSGAAGLNLEELVNIFRFKRNKQLKKMQQRLEEEEKERFVDYRFNKYAIRRVTGLEGKALDEFMKRYRPGFEFTYNSDVVGFYQYILDASYEFKQQLEKDALVNNRFNKELVQLATGLQGEALLTFMHRYKPGYEFCKSSSAAEFLDYIMLAYTEFKKDIEPFKKTDSLNLNITSP